MPIRNLIGTLVWRSRFKIIPALIFTAGFLGISLSRRISTIVEMGRTDY